MNSKLKTYPFLLAIFALTLFACEKEAFVNKQSTFEIQTISDNTTTAMYAASYRDIFCTLGIPKWGGCTPNWLGACLIRFPPQPAGPFDEINGTAEVSAAGELVLNIYAQQDFPVPTEEESFQVNANQVLNESTLNELFAEAGWPIPSSNVIAAGSYPATYSNEKIEAQLTMGETAVALNIWVQN